VLSSFFSFGCFLRLAAGLFWLRFVLVIDLFVADCILFSAFSLSVWSGNIWFSCCLRLEWSQRLCWNSFAAGGSVVGGDLVPPCGRSCCRLQWIVHLAPVVQTLDGAVHWINHYPLDNSIGFASVCPLDSDLSGGRCYPSFEQLGPGQFLIITNITLCWIRDLFEIDETIILLLSDIYLVHYEWQRTTIKDKLGQFERNYSTE